MFNSTITGNLVGNAEYAQIGAYDTAKFTIAVNHNKEDVTYVSCTTVSYTHLTLPTSDLV